MRGFFFFHLVMLFGTFQCKQSSNPVSLPKETSQSILALGGPLSAQTVANMVQSGTVKETTSKNGNTVFEKTNKLPNYLDLLK